DREGRRREIDELKEAREGYVCFERESILLPTSLVSFLVAILLLSLVMLGGIVL
ncbi:hypothetical protein CSUI_007771, partial [Cystoisospora suis]